MSLHRLLLCLRSCAAAAMLSASVAPIAFAQTGDVVVKIDAAKTGAPISRYLYGQFLEHGGDIVNTGVWAEMLQDRKFFYPITVNPPTEPWNPLTAPAAGPGRRRGVPINRWLPLGGDDVVTMDQQRPYTGEHSPEIHLDKTEAHGFEQGGLAVRAGRDYRGHIVLAGDSSASIQVRLAWGTASGESQAVQLRVIKGTYHSFPIQFHATADSDDAKLMITAKGSGTVHVGAVSLMPSNNIQGFRAEVVEALKQLHSGVYRFPGGNFVSAYEWREGVGERDRRPPIYDPVWRAVQPNDVGTDEFLTLCHLLDVESYITVNAGFGDAWSAAQLVEYTNGPVTTPMGRWRAANGHPEPYHVRFWGIGNEPWGDYQMGAMSLPQFEIKHTLFANAMRKVDPKITLIAGGAMPDVMEGANQAKRINGQYVPDYLSAADWSGNLLRCCLASIDMLSEHYYASGTEHTDMKLEKKVPIGPLSQIEWAREPATQVRAKYEHYQEYLNRIPALRAKPVPIAIDEWAYTGAQRDGFKVALAYAWAFHEMFRHSDVFQLGAFTFATAMMSANRTDAVLNPAGMMFRMYREHFGSIPVEVGGDSPQPKPVYPAGGDQPALNPGSPTYPVDVSAAITQDHKALTIAVINPSEHSQEIRISISGVKLAETGSLWRLAPDRVDAQVSVGKPPEVVENTQTLGALPEKIWVLAGSISILSYSVR